MPAVWATFLTIGESDCEQLGSGWLAQPVNALTSSSYVVVGVAIVIAARRLGGPIGRSVVYAACVAAIGIGSVLFHGPQPAGSKLLHDLPIVLTVLFIVVSDLKLLLGRPRADLAAFGGAAVAATALGAVVPDLVPALTAVGVVAVAVLEFVVFRRRARPVHDRRTRRAYAAIITVAAVAAGTYVLGRTDSPACDPDGLLQLHGLWHLVSSLIFGLWWWLAVWSPRRAPADSAAPLAAAQHG